MTTKATSRQRRHQKEHPQQGRATEQLKKAVDDGLLIKPGFCTICYQTERPIEAHHPDYDFPLLVFWLCHACHMLLHSKGKVTPTDIERRSKPRIKPLLSKPRYGRCQFCKVVPATHRTGFYTKHSDSMMKPDDNGKYHRTGEIRIRWASTFISHCEACLERAIKRSRNTAANHDRYSEEGCRRRGEPISAPPERRFVEREAITQNSS